MAPRVRKLSTALFAGGMVAGSPLIAACGGPSYDSWAATDGAAGRINLDDVQQAFKDSKSATDFESRVNEIYEGDGIILIRAQQDGDRLTLEGWEDLNGSNEIEDDRDDLLFSIVKHRRPARNAGIPRQQLLPQQLWAGQFSVRVHGGNRFHARPLFLRHAHQPGTCHPAKQG